MKKQINIVRGDEYRAKVEERFEAGLLFEDVYRRSYAIIREIVDDTTAYNRRCRNTAGYKTRYQGFGNNIIIYTADRGQGKTSSMQSFAEFLRNPSVGNKVLEQIQGVRFEVLDSIDPSAMDSGENIIRVLISRLFFAVDKTNANEAGGKNRDERIFRQDKQKLLELFQRCYDNIDLLKGKRGDEAQDDLENLAQLGNSAKLKENLHDLILQFLKIRLGDEKEDNSFLVIPIDDADLAMGNVYDICEDIHNYFSVPNVIVMMAASYTQISYAVYQKYLGQYKTLHGMQSKIPVDMKCYEMTMKYLEKVFPDGHRIELPRLEELIVGNNSDLVINYMERGIEEDSCLLRGELRSLLRTQIYEKTGVLLEGRTEGYHVFFPRTLRELTHFLKLLCDMESVDNRKAYQNIGEVSQCDEARKELQKIGENIRKLRQYFLNEWCGHLDAAQREVVCDIDGLERAVKLSGTIRILQEYLRISDAVFSVQEYTYHGVLRAVEENAELRREPMLQEGIYLSYTFLLNEWFTEALERRGEDAGEFQRFIRFLGAPVVVEDGSRQDPSGYRIASFVVHLADVRKNLPQKAITGEIKDFFEMLCTPVDADEGNIGNIIIDDDGEWQWNPYIDKIKVDIMRPAFHWLMGDSPKKGMSRTNEKAETQKDSVEDTSQGEWNSQAGLQYCIGAKTIITNYDMQKYQENQIERIFRKGKGKNDWCTLGLLVYQNLDGWKKLLAPDAKDTGEESLVQQWKNVFGEEDESKKNIFSIIFLCEERNRNLYIDEYYSIILTTVGQIEKYVSECLETLSQTEDFRIKEEITALVARMESNSMKTTVFFPAVIGGKAGTVDGEIVELENKSETLMHIYENVRLKAAEYIAADEKSDSPKTLAELMLGYKNNLTKIRRSLRTGREKYLKERAAGEENGNASGT